MNNKVVYLHRRLTTNEIFYVGIGTPKRPYKTSGRNKHWQSIVKRDGYSVDVVEKNISWNDAVESEIALIELIGRRDLNTGSLVNMTEGGEGIQGLIYTAEHKRKIGKHHKGNNYRSIQVTDINTGKIYVSLLKGCKVLKLKLWVVKRELNGELEISPENPLRYIGLSEEQSLKIAITEYDRRSLNNDWCKGWV